MKSHDPVGTFLSDNFTASLLAARQPWQAALWRLLARAGESTCYRDDQRRLPLTSGRLVRCLTASVWLQTTECIRLMWHVASLDQLPLAWSVTQLERGHLDALAQSNTGESKSRASSNHYSDHPAN